MHDLRRLVHPDTFIRRLVYDSTVGNLDAGTRAHASPGSLQLRLQLFLPVSSCSHVQNTVVACVCAVLGCGACSRRARGRRHGRPGARRLALVLHAPSGQLPSGARRHDGLRRAADERGHLQRRGARRGAGAAPARAHRRDGPSRTPRRSAALPTTPLCRPFASSLECSSLSAAKCHRMPVCRSVMRMRDGLQGRRRRRAGRRFRRYTSSRALRAATCGRRYRCMTTSTTSSWRQTSTTAARAATSASGEQLTSEHERAHNQVAGSRNSVKAILAAC